MNLTALKKMLATLKPLAKDAYKAAMAAREGKDAAAAQKVVRALFEHIPRDAILDAYAGATSEASSPGVERPWRQSLHERHDVKVRVVRVQGPRTRRG